ncbi:dUTP diphosphatase [Mycoplasma procyoni]|uniref:dUTP diphosphatase n=1 Tax=Mycoplasma procyoni TaxID=568784 RepID=UPI00197BD1DF|nr:dUTP diphosphatase [Mycoplasma procyoni]MBN3534844.1 dUTP diphosphatase [Mycoplasma procyoni]
MDFSKVFELQKELDKKFGEAREERFVFLSEEQWKESISIAIIVEIAEFANELQSFKYWKVHTEQDRPKLMEEWADIIHFLSSCSYKLGVDPQITPEVVSKQINTQLSTVFKSAVEFQGKFDKQTLTKLFSQLIGFLEILNIDQKELFDAYYRKAEINIKRIKNNY